VLSGLLADEAPALADRFAALLGTSPQTETRGGWRCLVFRRDQATTFVPACHPHLAE